MTEMTWPQFKAYHQGLDDDEISKRWKAFKEGTYFIGDDSQITPQEELVQEEPRETEELEELTTIPETPIVPAIVPEPEDEAEPEQAQEEPLEAEESEETPPEPPEPPHAPAEPQSSNDEKLAQRLRDSVIYGL